MTDQRIIAHIRAFYCLERFRGGFLEALSLKTVSYIEVVDAILVSADDLLSNTDTTIGSKLKADGVIADTTPHIAQSISSPRFWSAQYRGQPLGSHTRALKVVSTWNTEAGAAVVMLLFITSLVFSVTWSAVSAAAFHADVNASVQTGFTVGSFIITAGALLIVLVAFLDTQNAKVQLP
ncbi:MAG: pyridoxine biosynthesis protein [Watsoniomyces obsoletus]|nr:MAG: pyridoxine biosynthesis protein [Watsoniomyces obsoletus]